MFEIYLALTHHLSTFTWSVDFTGEMVAVVLLTCFAGLAYSENCFPKIKRPLSQTKQSYRTNIGLFSLNSLILSLCSVSTLYVIAERYSHLGLLSDMSNNILKLFLAFLAFDLLFYLWHRASHSFDLLWIFHRVHHNDPNLNVSTAFRLHIVEAVITNAIKALLIVLLGIDKIMVLLLEALSTLFIMFHHANIGFGLERALGKVVIVPYLHRVHHSTERSEHDNNYGAVLSLWDRWLGTLLEAEPAKIGIHGYSPLDVIGLVKFGLGLQTAKPVHLPDNLDHMIAEAAYYKAEKRNFRPGDDLRDWLEAKTEVMHQLRNKNRRQNKFFWPLFN